MRFAALLTAVAVCSAGCGDGRLAPSSSKRATLSVNAASQIPTAEEIAFCNGQPVQPVDGVFPLDSSCDMTLAITWITDMASAHIEVSADAGVSWQGVPNVPSFGPAPVGVSSAVTFSPCGNLPHPTGTYLLRAHGLGMSGDGGTGSDLFSAPFPHAVRVTCPTPPSCPGALFGSAASVSVGRYPVVTVADFNHDSRPDLATANADDDTVTVWFGNGDGTFGSPATYVTEPGPSGIASGDFDGDGDLDLATANFDSNSVSVLLNRGDGTFRPEVPYDTVAAGGSMPTAIITADLNGDGRLDLATVNGGTNNVSVLLGNRDGTFFPYIASEIPLDTGAFPLALTAADFNGDGTLDLATANEGDYTVSVLLGGGPGLPCCLFGPQQKYPTGAGPSSIAAADFDGDGRLDLVTANTFDDTVSVLFGLAHGTFSPPVATPVGDGPLAVATGDFDGDGKPDLVVANGSANDLSVLLGNGDGTFQPQLTFATGGLPLSVATADLNHDSKPDLAVSNGRDANVSVLLGNGAVGPIASARITSISGTASTGYTTCFDGGASCGSPAGPLQFAWSFGDGVTLSTGNIATVCHHYVASPTPFDPFVRITDARGLSSVFAGLRFFDSWRLALHGLISLATVTVAPTSDVTPWSCQPDECMGTYASGTSTSITIAPDAGYVFGAWTGCSGMPCNVPTSVAAPGDQPLVEIDFTLTPATQNTPVGGPKVIITAEDAISGGPSPVTVAFAQVTSAGATTVDLVPPPLLPPLPTGYSFQTAGAGKPIYFDVKTTALFSGQLLVGYQYDPVALGLTPAQESLLRMIHWTCTDPQNPSTCTPADVTYLTPDLTNHILYGVVNSLSPFAVASVATPPIQVVVTADANGFSGTLWPPNRGMVAFTLADCIASATDRNGIPVPVNQDGHILEITADEGDAVMHIDGDSSFSLQSARDGTGDGRVYTVFFYLVDAAGDVGAGSCRFQVPHSQNGAPAVDSGEHACVGTCL